MTALPVRPLHPPQHPPRHLPLQGFAPDLGVTPELRLVPPGEIPEGAVVLGHVVALPVGDADADARADLDAAFRSVRQLVAVPEPAPAPMPHRLQLGPDLVMDRWGRQVTAGERPVVLTRREFELLEHLVINPGRVYTRQQLLAAVWEFGDPRYAPARTVDVHVSRLRRKLGPPHGAALESLRGVGYRWTGRVEAL